MHKLLLVVCLLAANLSASATPSSGGVHPSPTRTFVARALGLADDSREVRPTGQCIVSCEDRLVTLKRCPDGDCPDYDCRSRYVNCGVR